MFYCEKPYDHDFVRNFACVMTISPVEGKLKWRTMQKHNASFHWTNQWLNLKQRVFTNSITCKGLSKRKCFATKHHETLFGDQTC